jgi:hypothetical protein
MEWKKATTHAATLPAPVQENPHKKAAARRTGADNRIEQMFQDLGWDIYSISKSNKDMMNFRAGSREFHDSKDLARFFEYDAEDFTRGPQGHGLKLIDVDSHLEESELFSLVKDGNPLSMYTWALTSPGGKSDEVDIAIESDGETFRFCTGAAPQGGYKHKVWDWNMDHVFLKGQVFTPRVDLAVTVAYLCVFVPYLYRLSVNYLGNVERHELLSGFVEFCTTRYSVPTLRLEQTAVAIWSKAFLIPWPTFVNSGYGFTFFTECIDISFPWFMFAGVLLLHFLYCLYPTYICCLVEHRDMGQQRVVVHLLPSKRLGGLAALMWEEDIPRLKRMSFLNAGGVFASRFLDLNGNAHISCAFPGLSHIFSGPERLYARMVAQGLYGDKTVGNVTTAEIADGEEKPDPHTLAILKHLSDQDVLLKTHSEPPRPVKKSFTINPQDPNCDEKSTPHRGFLNPMYPGATLIPRMNQDNLRASIKLRVEEPRKNIKSTVPDQDRLIGEFTDFIHEVVGDLSMAEYDSLMQNMRRPAQRRKLAEAEPGISFAGEGGVAKGCNKCENGKLKAPRIITETDPITRTENALFVYPMAEAFKKLHFYGPGKNPTQVGNRIAHMASTDEVLFATDFSSYDGSVGPPLRALFRTLRRKLFDASGNAEMALAAYKKTMKRKVFGKGLQWDSGYAQCSGCMDTSIHGTIGNAFLEYYRRRTVLEEAPAAAFGKLGIYCGDDGVSRGTGRGASAVAELFGMMLKEQVCRAANMDCVEYCSRFYPNVWGGESTSFCDVPRRLKKLHLTKRPASVGNETIAVATAWCIYHTDEQTPVLAWIAYGILRKLENVTPDEQTLSENYHGWSSPFVQQPSIPAVHMDACARLWPELDLADLNSKARAYALDPSTAYFDVPHLPNVEIMSTELPVEVDGEYIAPARQRQAQQQPTNPSADNAHPPAPDSGKSQKGNHQKNPNPNRGGQGKSKHKDRANSKPDKEDGGEKSAKPPDKGKHKAKGKASKEAPAQGAKQD